MVLKTHSSYIVKNGLRSAKLKGGRTSSKWCLD